MKTNKKTTSAHTRSARTQTVKTTTMKNCPRDRTELTLVESCMMRWRYRRRKMDARKRSRGQQCPVPTPTLVGVSSFEMASCDSSVGTDAAHDRCGNMRAGAPPGKQSQKLTEMFGRDPSQFIIHKVK